jgi:hypothetical protein
MVDSVVIKQEKVEGQQQWEGDVIASSLSDSQFLSQLDPSASMSTKRLYSEKDEDDYLSSLPHGHKEKVLYKKGTSNTHGEGKHDEVTVKLEHKNEGMEREKYRLGDCVNSNATTEANNHHEATKRFAPSSENIPSSGHASFSPSPFFCPPMLPVSAPHPPGSVAGCTGPVLNPVHPAHPPVLHMMPFCQTNCPTVIQQSTYLTYSTICTTFVNYSNVCAPFTTVYVQASVFVQSDVVLFC